MEPKEIKQIIECMLFVSDKPLTLGTIQSMLENVERRAILACLDELKAGYDLQGHAFHLTEIAEGYQLATRVQYAPWIRKMFKHRTSNKLSRAALESLAIIAYRQPVTKAEIEDIRGVSADTVITSLLDRRLIRIVGRKEVVGRPILYGTTKEFLHYFGLKDLTEMPMLKDLQEILDAEEAGKNWQVNTQGDIVARHKFGEENTEAAEEESGREKDGSEKVAAGITAAAGPHSETGEKVVRKAPETSAQDDVSEDGNGKPDTGLELEKEIEPDEDIDGDEAAGKEDKESTSEIMDDNGDNGGQSQSGNVIPGQEHEKEDDFFQDDKSGDVFPPGSDEDRGGEKNGKS